MLYSWCLIILNQQVCMLLTFTFESLLSLSSWWKPDLYCALCQTPAWNITSVPQTSGFWHYMYTLCTRLLIRETNSENRTLNLSEDEIQRAQLQNCQVSIQNSFYMLCMSTGCLCQPDFMQSCQYKFCHHFQTNCISDQTNEYTIKPTHNTSIIHTYTHVRGV